MGPKSHLPLIMATWLTALMGMIPLSVVLAQELSNLGEAKAHDVDNKPVGSATTFAGGFSVNNGPFLKEGNVDVQNPVKIVGEITVDPKDVGQVVDIVVYVTFATLDDPANPILLMLGNNGAEILPWNFDLAELVPFTGPVGLQATQRVEIYNGQLPAGKLRIFFGYLTGEALVVNRRPIEMTLEAISAISGDGLSSKAQAKELQAIDTSPMLVSEDDRLVGETGKRWPNGTTLKVGFDFNGADFVGHWPKVCDSYLSNEACGNVVAEHVIRYASEWSQYGNIYFTWAPWYESDIRISFREEGSYSLVGTDAKYRPVDQNTMNLAFSFWHAPEYMKGTTMHEFGHAIGLHHEHNSPALAYTWNEDQIIAELSGPPYNWDEASIRHNILDSLLASGKPLSAFFVTAFDPKSIMIYSIPKSWVSAADQADPERCPDAAADYYCVAKNFELSEMDKQGIAQFYPRREQQGNGCSMQYDPSEYRPGTSQWDGHTGRIAFNNPTNSTVTVKLYWPDWPDWPDIYEVLPGNYLLLDWWDDPLLITMDFGIQVNDSPVCIVKTVSDWVDDSYFQASVTRIPGM